MKRTACSLASFALLSFSVAALSAPEDEELRGYVTDDMCGAEHMMEGMTDEECADECVGMGAVYALYVPGDEKMYVASDPEKLEPFAGENVVVTGSVDEDGKTLTITSIERVDAS